MEIKYALIRMGSQNSSDWKAPPEAVDPPSFLKQDQQIGVHSAELTSLSLRNIFSYQFGPTTLRMVHPYLHCNKGRREERVVKSANEPFYVKPGCMKNQQQLHLPYSESMGRNCSFTQGMQLNFLFLDRFVRVRCFWLCLLCKQPDELTTTSL